MKKVVLLLVFVCTAQFATAQDEAFKKDVMKVIEVSGSAANLKLAKDMILKNIPAEKHAAFLVEFEATLPGLYENMAKIYMDLYTKEEIKAMLAFYETPVGKKMTANASLVAEKSQAAGKIWGQELQTLMMKYM